MKFQDLPQYETNCLSCTKKDYRHNTIIFNSFIFCQIFNEYSARKLYDEKNPFEGVQHNRMFLLISIVSIGLQVFLVEVGGSFVKTSPLTLIQWIITIGLGK